MYFNYYFYHFKLSFFKQLLQQEIIMGIWRYLTAVITKLTKKKKQQQKYIKRCTKRFKKKNAFDHSVRLVANQQ